MERVDPKAAAGKKRAGDEEEGRGEAAPLLDKASSGHSVAALGASPVERAAHRLSAGREAVVLLLLVVVEVLRPCMIFRLCSMCCCEGRAARDWHETKRSKQQML